MYRSIGFLARVFMLKRPVLAFQYLKLYGFFEGNL